METWKERGNRTSALPTSEKWFSWMLAAIGKRKLNNKNKKKGNSNEIISWLLKN